MIQVPVVKQYQNKWCVQATLEQRSSTSTSEELEVSQLAGSLKSMLLKGTMSYALRVTVICMNFMIPLYIKISMHSRPINYGHVLGVLCCYCNSGNGKQRPHGRRLLTADKTLVGACHRHSSDKI